MKSLYVTHLATTPKSLFKRSSSAIEFSSQRLYSVLLIDRPRITSVFLAMASPKSSVSFIELLPPKTYVPPDDQPKSNSFNADTGLPTADEIQEAMGKRRSSSTSTVPSVASSNEGERQQFLPLAAIPLIENPEEA